MATVKKETIIRNLQIVDISAEGKGIGKHEGLVIFVEGAVPGDVADVMVYRKKSHLAEARIQSLITPSIFRTGPVCSHFGSCGGCKWQHLAYRQQLQFKQKQVRDALERIGKLEFGDILPILPNQEPYFYRNKLEFSFSNKRWFTQREFAQKENLSPNALGFHVPGMFDKVLDIEECHLQPAPSNEIRLAIKNFALENNYSFYDVRAKQGFLRTLIIRNTNIGELMVLISVFEREEKNLFALLEFLKNKFPHITSLQYVHNPKGNDTLEGLQPQVFYGRDYIKEEMEGLSFKVSAKSFFQTNSAQAYHLYKIVRGFAALKGNELVYDLYTGTGTIANFISKNAKKIIGIEYVKEAIDDAKENSAANRIDNTLFFSGDIKDIMNPDFVEQYGKPDVVITDPPRAGMHPDVVNRLLELQPEKIVYVSCNPATQARDLALMKDFYVLKKIQPVDMFPQTSHVENVVLLERKKG